MCFKNPERDLKDMRSLDSIQDVWSSGKLSEASPCLMTSSQALSGTSMFSKTQDQTSWSMSWVSMPFKYLSGVLENMEVPDKAWDEVMRLGKSLRKLSWKFHWDQRSWTLLRLSVSFKFLSGLLKQMKVSDKTGYDVRYWIASAEKIELHQRISIFGWCGPWRGSHWIMD